MIDSLAASVRRLAEAFKQLVGLAPLDPPRGKWDRRLRVVLTMVAGEGATAAG